MQYNFDEYIDRTNTNSIKWDYSEKLTGRKALLPLWVADMDFRTPPEVLSALQERVAHGIFGYARCPQSYLDALAGWLERRHGWTISDEWVVPVPGVVPAIRIALSAFTKPGDKVIIQPPVYYPFRNVIQRNGRRAVENPLVRAGNSYEMDFDQLEEIIDDDTRLFLLCSPHNPVGRVWRRDELDRLTEVCAKHHLILLSDEIHFDLIMPGNRHLPAGGLSPEAEKLSVTLTSATKTFNLSGLSYANAIVPDPALRRDLRHQLAVDALELPNVLALAGAEAGYRHGEPWLDALLAYLAENYRFAANYLAEKAPGLAVFPLEGTYLMWIDFADMGIGDRELRERLLDGGLWLDDGPMFGTGGQGFQRVNIACPRSTLTKALEKIAAVARR